MYREMRYRWLRWTWRNNLSAMITKRVRMIIRSAVQRLEVEGFRPYWHQRILPNDGEIALGQVFAAARVAKGVAAIGAGGK